MPPVDKSKKEEQALAKVNTSLKLNSVDANITIEDLLASESLPSGFNSKEKIMTVVQYGKELGMDQLTAINSISLVKGRMVINSAMLGALLKRRGYEYLWTKDWEVTDFGTPNERITTEIEIMWISKNLNGKLMSQKFKMTWGELTRAGLTESPTYLKYPKQMMRARCITAAVRAIAPEILLGMYTTEEIVDTDPNIKLAVDEETGSITVQDTDYEEVKD